MNTLTDLKRLLDQGETITDGKRLMWKAPFPNQYTINHNLSTVTLDWDDILYLVAPDPSKWHQRDQIGAEKPVTEPPLKGPDVLMEQVMEAYSAPYKPEKPVMMMVPIEQWDALQEELTELRRFKEANTGSVWVGEPIGKMKPEEQEMESVLFAIFDKNKEAIDNAHYNLMAVGQALVIAKDGSLECERVKFEGSNDEVK